MFSKSELLRAIEELEEAPATFQNAEKLATFYTLYDHLFTEGKMVQKPEPAREVKIDKYGGSEFLEAIAGEDAEHVWLIIDELMETIKALQPKLYQATMDRINEP